MGVGEIIIVGLVVSAVGVAAYVVPRNRMRARIRAARSAMRKRGATVVREGTAKTLPTFQVEYGPATIVLSSTTPGRDGYHYLLSVKATLAYGELPSFRVKARPTVSRAPKLGVERYFDQLFVVECDDPEAVRKLWTERAAALMVRLGNPRLSGEGILPAIDARLVVDRRELSSVHLMFKRESTYHMLFELIEELVDAATWAERSRPSPVA